MKVEVVENQSGRGVEEEEEEGEDAGGGKSWRMEERVKVEAGAPPGVL